MSLQQQPLWRYGETGLALQVGERMYPLPPDLAGWLQQGTSGVELSADPAADLIRLERELRRRAAHNRSPVDAATQRVALTRAADGAAPGSTRARRTRRHHAGGGQATAIDEHAAATDALRHTRELLDAVRDFVIEADAPTGLLAEAAAGWRRDPHPPAPVIVFETEEAFLAGDLRRSTATASTDFGVPTIAGDEFGRQWRRDDDDDLDAEPSHRAGQWTLGFLARTAEIYAVRRASGLPWQVWLLGSGFSAEQAHPLLTGLLLRMHEPNSVVLAAQVVQTAVPRRSAPEPGTRPGASGHAVDATELAG